MDRVKLIDELVRDECIGGKPSLHPYRDSVRNEKYPHGILTIGIGRNLEDNGITVEEAYHLCHNDIDGVEADLDHAMPWWVTLDEVRQRALANMCFNLGIERLSKFKHALRAAQLQNWEQVAAELKSSVWRPQVGVRADRLIEAWRTGVMP
jgi:lysozyme